MQNVYSEIYLISDIHGYYQGLNDASKLCSEEKPLFVLGDLFDHKYGEENKIIDLLIKLSADNCLFLIKGNHDLVIELAFNEISTTDLTYQALTKEKNLKKFKIFETIFSMEYYQQFLKIREQLINSECQLETKLANYYRAIKSLSEQPNNIERYQALQKLFSIFKEFCEVTVNQTKLLLSHSGDITNLASRDTARASYQLNNKYDYGVMGHLTIPAVELMIEQEGDMLNYSQNFEHNYKLQSLIIEGNYMYNKHSKMIMIDDGSHTNVLTIK